MYTRVVRSAIPSRILVNTVQFRGILRAPPLSISATSRARTHTLREHYPKADRVNRYYQASDTLTPARRFVSFGLSATLCDRSIDRDRPRPHTVQDTFARHNLFGVSAIGPTRDAITILRSIASLSLSRARALSRSPTNSAADGPDNFRFVHR